MRLCYKDNNYFLFCKNMIKENYEKYETNYGDNIEEVSIIGYGLGDDRKRNSMSI